MLRTFLISTVVVVLVGVLALAVGVTPFPAPEPPQAEQETQLSSAKEAGMEAPLELIHKARDSFAKVKDYECIYLRDEFVGGVMKKNFIQLKVRHQPFSVLMVWVTPKPGRRAAYIEGQNSGRMVVKEPVIGRLAPTVRVDPEESKKRKESRHTIKEAGMKNLIDRYCTSWEKEKELGVTRALIQDAELRVSLHGREVVRPCRCVTTIHNPKDRERFQFYRTRLHFDKETHLLIRMEGYDWPQDASDKEGRLLEQFTYLDLKPNVRLTDADFRW